MGGGVIVDLGGGLIVDLGGGGSERPLVLFYYDLVPDEDEGKQTQKQTKDGVNNARWC